MQQNAATESSFLDRLAGVGELGGMVRPRSIGPTMDKRMGDEMPNTPG